MQQEKIVAVDLTEFTEQTIADLGESQLTAAHSWVAYTLGFAYQNQSETADLEGVVDVKDRLKFSDTGVPDRGNNHLFLSFMLKASKRIPATVAMLAAYHLPRMATLAPHRWLENLAMGFMKTGVTESYQVEAITNLFVSLGTKLKLDPDSQLFDYLTTDNRSQYMILLVLAHSAVKRGVLPPDKNQEEALGLLDDMFLKLNQPGGYQTLLRLSYRFLTHETTGSAGDIPELSEEARRSRLEDIVNPLSILYANSAHKVQLFNTQAWLILSELTSLLRNTSGDKPRDVNLFNDEYARQLALRTLMASPEVWREQLKRPTKGLSAASTVSKITYNLQEFLMELDSLRFENELPLQKKVFDRLFEALIPWVAKIKEKDCVLSQKMRLVDLLAPHVDLEAQYKAAKGLNKSLLKSYLAEHRRDLLGALSRKDRGRLIEDELGL